MLKSLYIYYLIQINVKYGWVSCYDCDANWLVWTVIVGTSIYYVSMGMGVREAFEMNARGFIIFINFYLDYAINIESLQHFMIFVVVSIVGFLYFFAGQAFNINID